MFMLISSGRIGSDRFLSNLNNLTLDWVDLNSILPTPINYHGFYVSYFSESSSFVSMVHVHNGNVENTFYEALRELLET